MIPAMLYGLIFLATSLAINFLYYSIIKYKKKGSKVKSSVYINKRSLISPVIIIIAIFLAFISPIITPIACVLTSVIWIIPSKIFRNIFNRLNVV